MTREERANLVFELLDQGLKNITNDLREILENAKEPCKHEPKLISQIVASPFAGIREADVFIFECKHCGVKIKAEKWVDHV